MNRRDFTKALTGLPMCLLIPELQRRQRVGNVISDPDMFAREAARRGPNTFTYTATYEPIEITSVNDTFRKYLPARR